MDRPSTPSILTKGESLLHVHTSGAVARRDTAPIGKEQLN